MRRADTMFFIGFIVFTLVILVFATYTFYLSERKSNTEIIGDKQIKLLEIYGEGEKQLFFIDKSAEYVQGDAFLDLSSFDTGCGSKNNYYLWKKGFQDCFLTQDLIQKQFNKTFNSRLNEYFINYGGLLQDNYEIILKDNYVMGNAINPLNIKAENISYLITPNFKIKTDYNFDSLLDISEKAKKYSEECKDDLNCWNLKAQQSTYQWQIDKNGKVFMFDVNTNLKVGFFEQKEFIVKFAIDFEENPLFTS